MLEQLAGAQTGRALPASFKSSGWPWKEGKQGVPWLYHQELARQRRDHKGQGSVQRAAGGSETKVAAMLWVHAETSALAVRWGMGVCPGATQEGD